MKLESLPDRATTVDDGKTWTCNECGSIIMGKVRAMSLHYRDMPLAGCGEVRTITEPYCPNCDKEPSSTGFMYYDEDPVERRERAILRRIKSEHDRKSGTS